LCLETDQSTPRRDDGGKIVKQGAIAAARLREQPSFIQTRATPRES
jgi:hypothetical protein